MELLIEIEGIGNKRIQMIAESWLRQKEVKNIIGIIESVTVTKRNTMLRDRLAGA